jgi:predicted transcriptional regulator
MDELCALLFELSNEDRLNILRELKKKPMRLSRVSERFNFTVPETARNMTRLAEADLIAKDVNGYFHLTPIGEATLQFIPSFEFISRNKKYFKTHTFSSLPAEFAASIGALRKSEYVNGVTEMLFNAENAVKESREFMWIIVDQILPSSLPFFLEAIARGVEVRKLMPRNAAIPQAILELANDPAFDRAARAKKVESRYLDTIGIFMFLSEKELAGIGFANLEGIFDYGSFRSRDATALKWAESLFLHYWGRAKRE